MSEEMAEVEMKEDHEMDTDDGDVELTDTSATLLTNGRIIPHQHQLAQIDQRFPPPNRPILPISFQSAGKKPKRLNESMTVTAVSPAAALYRDALHSIFLFLDLKEFVRACVISKSWYAGGQQMKPRKDELHYDGAIFLLVQSPLRHHITKLTMRNQDLDLSSLVLLQIPMGHLEELRFRVRLTKDDLLKYSSPVVCFVIPKQLQSLDISFLFWIGCDLERDMDADTYVSECMKQIALQSTRLVKLHLKLVGAMGSMAVCPQALQTITTLTELMLPDEIDMNHQIDLIKALPSIRIWHRTKYLSPKRIQHLAEGPTGPPQLEDIGGFQTIYEVVNDAMAEQLKRLVTLTKLETRMSLADPTKLLPHFPHLSILLLGCEQSVNTNQLAVALSTCVSLIELRLNHDELTSLNVAQFLPHLRSLLKLTFNGCYDLVSLGFLTTARKSLGNLRFFMINGSTQMPINEYHHLDAISSSLEHLEIRHSSMGRFDPLTIGRWTPGSKEFSRHEWPKLKSFTLCQ